MYGECGNNLHSYRFSKKAALMGVSRGNCVVCNQQIIDWDRIRRFDVEDLSYLKMALETEKSRYAYWDISNPVVVLYKVNKISRLSDEELLKRIERRLVLSVGKPKSKLYRDGMQTPRSGNLFYMGQHATATCCRKCIDTWYGIDVECSLTSEHINYFSDVIMYYIKFVLESVNNA